MKNFTKKDFIRKAMHVSFGTILLFLFYYNILELWHFLVLWLVGFSFSVGLKLGLNAGFIGKAIQDLDKDDFMPAQGMLYYYSTFLFLVFLQNHYGLDKDFILHSFLVLMFADPASFIAGKGFGKTKLPFHSKKTILGTATGMLVAVVVSLLFVSPIIAIVIGVLSMTMDVIDVKIGNLEIDDNFLIPSAVFVLRLLLL